MSTKKQCRICGNDYEPCHSTKLQVDVFRWREVACSPECGATYLRQIMESRNKTIKENKKTRFKRVEPKFAQAEIVVDSEGEVNALEPNRD